MTLQLEQNPNLTKPTLSLGSLRTAYEAPIADAAVERADIRQSRRAVKPIKRENLPRLFVHIDGAVADVWPAEDQSADAIRARARRWVAIVCAEVRRLFPAGSPDRKAAETFAFQHRISIANCFYRNLKWSDVVSAIAGLYEASKMDTELAPAR